MKRTYTAFRPSTPEQRRRLFAVWEETGSVPEACRQTQLSRRTFYYWKPRFEAGGYPALEKTRSHAPKNPMRTPPDVEKLIVGLKQQHPAWGKLRIAQSVVQQCDSIATISPNTVRRILEDAGLWQYSA